MPISGAKLLTVIVFLFVAGCAQPPAREYSGWTDGELHFDPESDDVTFEEWRTDSEPW